MVLVVWVGKGRARTGDSLACIPADDLYYLNNSPPHASDAGMKIMSRAQLKVSQIKPPPFFFCYNIRVIEA